MHGTRINSAGARRSPFSPLNFFVCRLLHFFPAAQSRKLGARERSRGCQATLRKSRGARAIIARVILPRVSERKAIRRAKLYTASLPEKREELAAKVAQKYRMAAERAGDSQLSPTPETCARGATFQSYSGREFCEFSGRMRMRSLLLLCARVVSPLTRSERWIDLVRRNFSPGRFFAFSERQQSTWHFNWNCAVTLNPCL